MQHGLMPKDDVRAMIDQLVRPAPQLPSSPCPKEIGGHCGSPGGVGVENMGWDRSADVTPDRTPRHTAMTPDRAQHGAWKESNAQEVEYLNHIRSLHNCASKQKAQIVASEDELHKAQTQLMQAAESIVNLEAEVTDLRQMTTELKAALSQSETDKAVLMQELEKQLQERDMWACKSRDLEDSLHACQSSRDAELVQLQAKIADLSILQLQNHQHSNDAQTAQKVSKIRADLHCLLHKLSLLETTSNGSGSWVGSEAVPSSQGSAAVGASSVAPAPPATLVGSSSDQEPLGTASAVRRATTQEPMSGQPGGVHSCCEIGSNKDGPHSVAASIATRVWHAPSPCRTAATPRRSSPPGAQAAASKVVVSAGAVAPSTGASVQTVMSAPTAISVPLPLATVMTSGVPAGTATCGANVGVRVVQATPAYPLSVDSPVRRRSSVTSMRAPVRSCSPSRQYSYSLSPWPGTPRMTVGSARLGGSVQVPPSATVRATVPAPGIARTEIPGVWAGYAPAVCTTACGSGSPAPWA